MTVLLDTGVVFAFLNADDARHSEAVQLMTRIARREFGAPLINDHAVDELFVLIRARTGSSQLEEAARKFLPLPTPLLRGLSMVSLGTSLIAPAWEVFRRYRDQGLSFTDAGLIVTMQELRIERLATFDRRLSRLVPVAQ
ncbi:MAG: PIN domain-containing protein [Thermoplasmata archaeon]